MKFSSTKIKNLEINYATGATDNSFVGLKYIGNKVYISSPECYRIIDDDSVIRQDILDLLGTISIAKTASIEKSKAYNTQNKGGEFALFSYLWVINDFLANGFYVNREKVYKTNQNGKINWKRTMQTEPIISKRSIIFPDIVVEKKSEADSILIEVHKLCVKKSIDNIGWLFNLSSDFIQTPRFTESLKKVYLNAIKRELDHTFLDNKRLLLNHMKNVIEGLDENANNRDFVYGVDSYYYIFERMIDSIFGNVDNIKDFYPAGQWVLLKNEKPIPSSNLRPDTIILKDENGERIAFILDSKFYRFGFTGNDDDLPETTSIQKQITYGEYVKRFSESEKAKIKVDKVYSAFIIPFDKEREQFKSNNNMEYVGYAKSDWKDNDNSHEIVHTFLIDLKHVIKTWNNYNHKEDVDSLVKGILHWQEEYEKNQPKS